MIAALAIVLLSSVTIAVPFAAVAQQPLTPASELYISEEDGFSVQIPQGWVIEVHDIVPLALNGEGIALMCLENEALPGLGGEYNCQAATLTDAIYISRHPDLQSLPEFEDTAPTTNDLLALWIQYLQNNTSNLQIVNNTDFDEFTKIVNMTYTTHDEGSILPFDETSNDVKTRLMFVLSQDRNTGYQIVNTVGINNQTSPAVQEVFDSFELIEEGETEGEEEDEE